MRKTIDIYNTTSGHQYLRHRAQSARWEAERNRQQMPLQISRWRLLADGAAITLCALVVAVAIMMSLRA